MTLFTLPKGFRPESIVIGEEDQAYLGSLADGSIYRLNLKDGTGSTVYIGTGAPAGGIKLSDDGLLYVAGGFAGDARVIDPARGELVASYQLAQGRPCLVADVALALGAAWFTDAFHPVLYRVGDAVTEIPLGVPYREGEYNIGGIASTPDGAALLVAQANTGLLFRVDPATGAAAPVDLGGELLPSVDGLTICKSTLYAAMGLANEVAIIDLSDDGASGSIRKRVTSEHFDVPTCVAPQGAFLYIVNAQLDGRELDPAAEYTVVAVARPPHPAFAAPPPTFPFDGSSFRGPDPRFTRWREESPIVRVHTRDGVDAWLVTDYEHVRALSADPRLSRAAACGPDAPKVGGTLHTTPEMIISMDSPEHSRLRKLVAGSFTMRRIEQMRPKVEAFVDGMLDGMQAKGSPADLVASLCLPLPVNVICDLLGVPPQDVHSFEKWIRAFATVDDRSGGEVDQQTAFGMIAQYMSGLIARKRAHPADDILSELIAARDNDDRLSEQELVTFGFILIGAGFDTTACQLANSVLALIEYHRDQWEWLCQDPAARMGTAVEELLRHVNLFATDTTGFPRVALQDITAGDTVIKAGDAVMLVLSSANRDAAVFPEPDRLDLSRERNPHLSFGHGLHNCLGKHLARLELEVALHGLIRRFPDLRLDVPAAELPWHRGEINHTLLAMPVRWDGPH